MLEKPTPSNDRKTITKYYQKILSSYPARIFCAQWPDENEFLAVF